MFVRYKREKNGKAVPQARVWTREEHGINPEAVDSDTLKIAQRLERHGYAAYIVGGAVRDLILGQKPKDFDMATDAVPSEIRKLFRNSRIIGKRFRLVHIVFRGGKVIEMATFRSEEASGFRNVFGEIEEDAKRRDFTINSLYYSPTDETVIDYTGGLEDVRNRRLRPVIPLDRIFTEDPFRMIRAVKYAVSTDSTMRPRLRRLIRRSSTLLSGASPSRATEEAFKILLSSRAAATLRELDAFRLLQYLLPEPANLIAGDPQYRKRLLDHMGKLDEDVRERSEERRSHAIALLCAEYIFRYSSVAELDPMPFRATFDAIKRFLAPLSAPNVDVEGAAAYLILARQRYLRDGTFVEHPHRPVHAGGGRRGPTSRRRRRPTNSPQP